MTTPTVRIETTFHRCTICGACRKSFEAMDSHFANQHEDDEISYVIKTSVYGQPAGDLVPAGDVVISAQFS